MQRISSRHGNCLATCSIIRATIAYMCEFSYKFCGMRISKLTCSWLYWSFWILRRLLAAVPAFNATSKKHQPPPDASVRMSTQRTCESAHHVLMPFDSQAICTSLHHLFWARARVGADGLRVSLPSLMAGSACIVIEVM